MSNVHNKRRKAAAAMVAQSGASSFFSSWSVRGSSKSKAASAATPQPEDQQQHHDPVPAVPVPVHLPIRDPNENDVLCGRGGLINGSRGNVQFREIVAAKKKEYNSKSTKRTDKANIAADVVRQIRSMNPPGRFLKECPNGLWYDVGDAKAIRKAGQALRESAPSIREELEKSAEFSKSGDISTSHNDSNSSNEGEEPNNDNDVDDDTKGPESQPDSKEPKDVKKIRRSSKVSIVNRKGRQVTASPDATQSMPGASSPPRVAAGDAGNLSSESSTPPPTSRSGRNPASCVSRRGGKRIRQPIVRAQPPTHSDPAVQDDPPHMPPLTVEHNRVKLPTQYPPLSPGYLPPSQQYAAVGFSFPPTRSSIQSAQTRALLQQSAAEHPHLAPYSPFHPAGPGHAVRRSSDLAFGREFFPTAENNSSLLTASEGSGISDVTCSGLTSSITAGEHKHHPHPPPPRQSHEHYTNHHDVLALHRANTAPYTTTSAGSSAAGASEENNIQLYDPLIARTNSLPQFHANIGEVATKPNREETSDMTTSSDSGGGGGKGMGPPPNVAMMEDGDRKPRPYTAGPAGIKTRITRSDTTSGSAMDLDESFHSNCGTSDISDTLMALHLEHDDDMASSLLS